MNLISDPIGVEAALVAMGDYARNDQRFLQQGKYSFPHALELSKLEDFEGCVIYGAAGVARYIVYRDGTVRFSKHHGSHKAEQAARLGFELC